MTHHLQKLRDNWLTNYAQFLKKHLPTSILNSSNLSIYISMLSSLILMAAFFSLTSETGLNLILQACFEFFVFYLCLGKHNLFFMNTNISQPIGAKEYILSINQDFIAIILWFFIFGPAGAILYRVTLEFSKIQEHEKTISQIKDVLDWVPTRLTSLIFLMVGQFEPGIRFYLKNFMLPPIQNSVFLLNTAEKALAAKNLDSLTAPKLEELFSHSCLMLIFTLAIYMIGRLL
jgi:AmpE protein